MRKFLLIASVAAMAVTAPAQAEREGRGERGQRAERAEQNKQQRAQRTEQRQQRAERSRPNRQQASDRGAARQQQVSDRRSARQQQASDRRSARQQQVSDRRSARQQQASERRSFRQQAVSDRRARSQQVDRRERAQQAVSERRARAQQIASDRRSRIQQERSDRRSAVRQVQSDRRSRIEQARSDRRAFVQQQRSDRRERLGDRRTERRLVDQPAAERINRLREQRWEQRADRVRVLAERREQLRDRLRRDDDGDDRRTRQSLFRVGERVSPTWWADDYVPLRYRASFDDDDRYYYRYDGDYLYRLRDNDNVVLSLFPLLGGAYSVGSPLPFYQSSYYNVPYGYSSLYYDTPDHYYRYGDGGIYQVDPTTQLIAGIVALLTGQNLGIGQRMPFGYDAYNVPYAYRSSYYDTDDMWYRYNDGYIYGFDPRTRYIQSSYPVYGGYAVGAPWPSYAGYDYGVPNYYEDLYYQQPNYDYRFASGGIYQVDPTTQLVTALVALVTGQNFGVGQRLPLGYDAYNVPFAYRDDYYDNDDNWYRYADGRIYQVDPGTRLIRRVIMV